MEYNISLLMNQDEDLKRRIQEILNKDLGVRPVVSAFANAMVDPQDVEDVKDAGR